MGDIQSMDDEVTPLLECDVKLNFIGPNVETLNKWAADVLRKLADRVENGGFQDGFHPVTDNTGKPVGEIYVDYSGYSEELA